MESKSKTFGCAVLLWIIFGIAWAVNLVKFIQCDFDAPYKEEIIHAVGIIFPPTAILTAWF